MKRGWKLWTIVGVVILVGLLMSGAYVLNNRAQAQMQPPKATSDEALLRIAGALERIAATMEKTASSGMMGGMMSGMGSGMMGNMMSMMGHMMDIMGGMMNGMMGQMAAAGPQQMQEMMKTCQKMGGMMGQAPGQPSEAALTRTSSGAGIEVSVTYMNPLMKPEETGGKLIFKIALDTHAGDLLQYDLTKLAVLRTSEGLIVDKGFVWESQSESGHHRMGLLKVDAAFEGKPLITKETKYIELELKNIGIPSRVFRWELATLMPSS